MSAPTFTQHAALSSSKTNGDGHAGARGSDGEPLPIARSAKPVPTADVPPSGSLAFIEQVYDAYQDDPTSVSPDWREYFESLAAAGKTPLEQHPEDVFPRRSIFHHATAAKAETPDESTRRQMKEVASLQERVDQIIRNYRVRGHIIAQVDPLHQPKEMPAELDPAFYGFIDGDLDRKFSTSWLGGPERRTLRQIISWLQNTYCRSIGAQFMHIYSLRVGQWLQDRLEVCANYLMRPRD
jgi:2-oxoglutarate dehydrogenase E1 component